MSDGLAHEARVVMLVPAHEEDGSLKHQGTACGGGLESPLDVNKVDMNGPIGIKAIASALLLTQ